MATKKMDRSAGSFWTTLPGILTGTAALLSAGVAAWAAITHQPIPTPSDSEAIPIQAFVKKEVVERHAYKIRDESEIINLTVVNVKAKKRRLDLNIGLSSGNGTDVSLVEGTPTLVVLKSHEYALEVHDFKDQGRTDLASVSVHRR